MPPAWFEQALLHQPEQRFCLVHGAQIAYLHWPNPGKPGLVFVHGHAAHSHWWDFIAPAFTDRYDIIAIDSSGSGDSDHRDEYSATLFAEEIIQCAEQAGLASTIVIGHSFGGSMTRITAHLYPARLTAIVIVDAAISLSKGNRRPPPMPRARVRSYATLAEGKRRFRLRPPQPCENTYLLDYIAGHSLRKTDTGYAFKLDGAVFAKMSSAEDFPAAADMVRALQVPVGFIYGENSRFFPASVVASLDGILDPVLVHKISNAHHHVFLDQPLVFIEALDELLPALARG